MKAQFEIPVKNSLIGKILKEGKFIESEFENTDRHRSVYLYKNNYYLVHRANYTAVNCGNERPNLY